MSIRVVTLFFPNWPWRIDFLASNGNWATDACCNLISWRWNHKPLSPQRSRFHSFFCSPSHNTYLNTCSLMKANREGARERESERNSQMKQRHLWNPLAAAGNRSKVIWHCWAKSPWVLYRSAVYSIITYRPMHVHYCWRSALLCKACKVLLSLCQTARFSCSAVQCRYYLILSLLE